MGASRGLEAERSGKGMGVQPACVVRSRVPDVQHNPAGRRSVSPGNSIAAASSERGGGRDGHPLCARCGVGQGLRAHSL
jgi:hypothetical protein